MTHAIKLIKTRFAHLYAAQPGPFIRSIFGFTQIRAFLGGDFYDPMFISVGHDVSRNAKPVRFGIPSDNGLGLSSAGRRPDPENFPESIGA